MARWATLVSAAMGVGLAITSASIVLLLTIFYSLLTASLFVPIVAGLYVPRTRTPEALASIVCGVAAMLSVQYGTAGRGIFGVTPALAGIIAASIAFGVVFIARSGGAVGSEWFSGSVRRQPHLSMTVGGSGRPEGRPPTVDEEWRTSKGERRTCNDKRGTRT